MCTETSPCRLNLLHVEVNARVPAQYCRKPSMGFLYTTYKCAEGLYRSDIFTFLLETCLLCREVLLRIYQAIVLFLMDRFRLITRIPVSPILERKSTFLCANLSLLLGQ
jgi:hypothetical protein